MALDKALQPENSAKVLGREMLAGVEELATMNANQVPEEPEAEVQVVLSTIITLKLAAQEKRTSAEVAVAEAPEVKAVPAS